MKKCNTYIVGFLMCMLFACQNEVDKFDVTEFVAPGDYVDALELVQDLSVQYTILNEMGVSIALNNAVVQFSPNAFIDLNGAIVIGEVTLAFIEIINNRDILKYDLATMDNNGALLNSEYMLKIVASQDGKELLLNPQIESPKLFVLDNSVNERSVYILDQDDIANGWFPSNTNINAGSISYTHNNLTVDTTGYDLSIDNLGWISIQSAFNASNFTTLCLKLSDSNTEVNTLAYILFDNSNTCHRLNISSNTECAMTEVPQEVEGTIVILAHKGQLNNNQHLEFYTQRVLISANMADFELKPSDVDEEAFIELIQGL